MKQEIRADFCNLGQAHQPHGAVDLAAKNIQHLLDARFARRPTNPTDAAARSGRRCAPSARALTTSAPRRTPPSSSTGMSPLDRFDDGRQRVDRGRSAVELASAMVGNDHAIDAARDRFRGLGRMKNALQQERALPQAAQPFHVAPGHRRIEQRRHRAASDADIGWLSRA